ncbi:MAG: hypothetical protein IH889_04210 [Planctomycetes bacterium]|nr:hypothetical protein [Planctomycetota bacterium]
MGRWIGIALAAVLPAATLAGCSTAPGADGQNLGNIATSAQRSADRSYNPSFGLSITDAKAILRDMRMDPKPLERPVIVAGGIFDPGIIAQGIASKLRRLTTDGDRIISVSFTGFSADTFDECRDRLIEAIERRFPSDNPAETVEVDVIGFSMGGLVARHAARPREVAGKRLNARRLFTISTPHRGARQAGLPTWDQRTIDMRADSAFLGGLDTDLPGAEYELYPYVRLGDMIVGQENAAPVGQTPWWVPNAPFAFAHLWAGSDRRILADIARRLRGEAPFATHPPAALPVDAAPVRQTQELHHSLPSCGSDRHLETYRGADGL